MPRDNQVEVQWRFITYRTLLLIGLLVVAAAIIVLYSGIFPGVSTAMQGWFAPSAAAPVASVSDAPPQARFINVEGGVLLKKAGRPDFLQAHPSGELDQGDTVQTQADGWARIEFADNTTYLLSPNSLIIIEQSRLDADSAQVAVNVSSGRVDLSTGQASGGRRVTSRVQFADAHAALRQGTRAEVVTGSDSGSLTVVAGGAEVRRGKETVRVAPFQQVHVAAGKSLQVASLPPNPHLLAPSNLSPILAAQPKLATVRFRWSRVPQATQYQLRLSRSPLMSDSVVERSTSATSLSLSGLAAGDYYWTVAALDAKGRHAPSLDANKFTLLRSVAPGKLLLRIDGVSEIAPGVLEIHGHTAPGAKVLVNHEVVGLIQTDGSFQYVTRRLSRSSQYTFTVTAEDNLGRVTTRSRRVQVQ